MWKYVIALDQGTTSSRAIIFDHDQKIVQLAQKELRQIYPQEGWVEQDPLEIYASQYEVLLNVLLMSGINPADVGAIGITNQRETTIIWEKATGRPIYNAIVWQCRRTAPICQALKAQGLEEYLQQNTGLRLDAYFSATKIKWILDQVPGARAKARRGELLFGTVDTWLLWRLTKGKVHVTDYTNASRTMLFNIHSLQWDEKILRALDIPSSLLPQIRSSSEVYGYAEVLNHRIPIGGVAGDQQAALFGQACFQAGEAKNTYGTGCFLLMNTGNQPCFSSRGMLTTLAASPAGEPVQYALEGSIFTGGSVIQWLRDEMRFFSEAQDSEYFARKVPDSGGVYFVPAFTGLGAPHWDMYARGTLLGITPGTNRSHITRAALEAIGFQSKDLLDAIVQDTGCPLPELKVDGGASANDFLMQFQADILGRPVKRAAVRETTALGAAGLAGLAVGFWQSLAQLKQRQQGWRIYEPTMAPSVRQSLLANWSRAVERAKAWAQE